MTNKKIPLRKCVATQERHPKQALIRVVMNKEKEVSIDETGKAHGRGAYLKKDAAAINLARKRKSLERAFNHNIDPIIYDKLLEKINGSST